MEFQPAPPLQRLVLLLALLFFALVAIPSWVIALACYLAALVLVNLILFWNPHWNPWQAATRSQRWLLAVLLIAVPGAFTARMLLSTNPAAQADTVRENLEDRLALERLPAIFPALLATYEPQRFLIYAPNAKQVTVRWTPKSPDLSAIDLGQGVFLLDVDPRADHALVKQSGTELSCVITADGSTVQRSLRLVQPQPHPRLLHSDPAAGIAAAVSEETDELFIVRRDGQHQRVAVGDGPTDGAVFDEGRQIVVAHRHTPQLWVIDAAQGKVTARHDSGRFQTRLAVSPNGRLLAVAEDSEQPALRLIRLSEMQEIARVPLPFSPDLVEFGDETTLVVTDRRGRAVHRLSATAGNTQTTETPTSGWGLVEGPLRFPRPITALGKHPELHCLALATTASLLTDQQPRANHFIENTIHTLDVGAWQITATRITDRRGQNQDQPGETEHGIAPLALAVIDNRLLAAFSGSNEVGEVPLNGVAPHYLGLDEYPLFAPRGLADLGGGSWCVSSACDGTIGVFNQAAELQKLIPLAAKDEALSPGELIRRHGERTFFEGTRAGIACQSCHVDSMNDGCLHDIGQNQAVDVQSVRGIAGTSPYLRDASHWRLQDLHDVAEQGYRGHPRPVEWDRAAAVAAYMNSLPPAPHARLTAAYNVERMRAGVAAFFAADCQACHTPPALTNLGQQSALSMFPDYYGADGAGAGTDLLLDTPSLRGLAVSGPYLHNGRAATLREVLTKWNRENRHGNTRDLPPEQLDDILYLLERL